jgi:D-alanine-D-alanine ligase
MPLWRLELNDTAYKQMIRELIPEMAHIAIVFNELIIEPEEARKFAVEAGKAMALASSSASNTSVIGNVIDLSEMGVIEEREKMQEALQQKGYRTSLFNINGDIKKLIKFLEETRIDLIFNLCESLRGQAINEMHVAGVFELMNIPYTGAAPLALGTCLNKVRTKVILDAHGISTARHALYKRAEEINLDDLRLSFPMIVKPSREDASVGIENSSVVHDIESLRQRVAFIVTTYNQPALVEEYIEGRELNVAIIGNERPMVLPISEIDFSKLPPEYPKIVTYNAKWVEGTAEYIGTVGTCPAKLTPEMEERVRDIARQAYKLMEIRDYARVDIRLDASNTPYVLEVNPNPDISRDTGFARSAHAAGMTFEDMLANIIETALERTRQ